MILVNFGRAQFRFIENKYGVEIQKQRRDSLGRYGKAERWLIRDYEKIVSSGENYTLLKLKDQLGLL